MTTAEAARRLGVKRDTIYAYASRGLIRRGAAGADHRARFRRDDVERMRTRGRKAAHPPSTELPVESGVSLIEGGRLHYRGLDAILLSRRASLEQVSRWLWHGNLDSLAEDEPPSVSTRWTYPDYWPEPTGLDGLPMDRLIGALAALPPDHVTDNPEAVLAYAARTLGRSQAPTIAGRLAAGLATTPDLAPGVVALVDAALILAADNGLARPTLCARIVASVGGEMRYGVVAGMCAMRGTLPGAAAHSVDHLLSQIDATGAAQAGAIIRAAVAAKGTTLPGVGHQMYPGGDPRAQELLRRLLSSPSLDPCRVAVVTTAVDALKRESLPAPNFDFALAALCYAAGLRAGGSEALFCVGRMAGWLAHMLEERHRSSNFRLNGVYVGLWPSSTVPLSGLDGMPV